MRAWPTRFAVGSFCLFGSESTVEMKRTAAINRTMRNRSVVIEHQHIWKDSPIQSRKFAPLSQCALSQLYTLFQKGDSKLMVVCSVLFFSRPRSEGWPHHIRTLSISLCRLSFWLTLPRDVLSTFWCCPPRPYVVFLACVHLALFLALSLFPLISWWFSKFFHYQILQ